MSIEAMLCPTTVTRLPLNLLNTWLITHTANWSFLIPTTTILIRIWWTQVGQVILRNFGILEKLKKKISSWSKRVRRWIDFEILWILNFVEVRSQLHIEFQALMRPLPLSLWCMAVVWRMYGDSDGTGILFLKTWTLAWTASGVLDDHMGRVTSFIYTPWTFSRWAAGSGERLSVCSSILRYDSTSWWYSVSALWPSSNSWYRIILAISVIHPLRDLGRCFQ